MPNKIQKSKTMISKNEIEHGKRLAAGGAEELWGWGSPAGQQRAIRRGSLVAAKAGLNPSVTALELGCGTGLFSALFAATGAQITAIDISPDLINIARKNVPGVEFICARFEDSAFSTEFDAVIGSSVLHHLDVTVALKRAFSLLKPGGRLAFAEPNMLNPQVFAERTFLRKKLHYVSPDETAFFRWKLSALLHDLGFIEVDIRPFDWLHPAIPRGLVNSVENIGKVVEKIPLVCEFAGSLLISGRKPTP